MENPERGRAALSQIRTEAAEREGDIMWQIADYRGEGGAGSVPDARRRVISETIAERGPSRA